MLHAVVSRGRTSLRTSFLSKHGRVNRRTSFVPKCSYRDSADISIYRSLVLQHQHQYIALSCRCFCATFVKNTNLGDESINSARIRIGDVEHEFRKDIDENDKPLIPVGFLPKDPSNEVLNHLQWMMAKDNLNQDMLLIGPPGSGSSYRRQLAFMYAEMTNQPVEILTLSSDITESELKQRRELISHQCTPDSNTTGGGTSVVFVDQPPVRAALKGRILILDGLEKVDRNVLPTLNNLLENREMNLEDGRFLIPPKRYSQLSSQAAYNTLQQSDSFLTPIHEKFRVIALGVPVPPYEGQTLDPPLRSRFQIRRILNPSSSQMFSNLTNKHIKEEVAKSCAVFGSAMEDAAANITDGTSRPFHFPFNAMESAAKVMEQFPIEPPQSIFARHYPIGSPELRFANKRMNESQKAFARAIEELGGTGSESFLSAYNLISASSLDGNAFRMKVDFSPKSSPTIFGNNSLIPFSVTVPCGGKETKTPFSTDLVETIGSKNSLTCMMQEHFSGRDILLTSRKGEGKSAIAKEFASILGYEIQLFCLYKDMSAQDLLVRRTTNSVTGETGFDESPLLKAAREGHLCVLDGLEKVGSDTVGTLQSLLIDRLVHVPLGTNSSRDESSCSNYSNSVMSKVHPSFRVIALGSSLKDGRLPWITEQLQTMFSTIVIPESSRHCLKQILSVENKFREEDFDKILNFHENLTETTAADCGILRLSTRNLLRLMRSRGAENDLYGSLCSILGTGLLPAIQKKTLESLLEKSGIRSDHEHLVRAQEDNSLEIHVDTDTFSIGTFTMPRMTPKRPEMVPSPRFTDIPNHLRMIMNLLEERQRGERAFLLLGNQGVGKNKIVDRLCQLGNFEREYIQLHRDSTIGQLTLSPSLKNGKVVWKDSPLVRAILSGRSLVIDEADKAPLEVISILKSLVEDGDLLLADGRRISVSNTTNDSDTICVHPDFTVWVLANRPGFPFHGNNIFHQIGDCFSSHIIPNPDVDSEIQLLRSYAPNISAETLKRVAASFAELRALFENGDITYPYSTREAVSIVSHLEKYPQDSIGSVLHNILDIDSFNKNLYTKIMNVFRSHGFSVENYYAYDKAKINGDGNLQMEYLTDESSKSPPKPNGPKHGKWDDDNKPHVGGNQWAGGTGGSDTAGLGGRGGPYRLDRGHTVHQVSDEAKLQVSDEAAIAAQNIARKKLAERLNEIGMSETEYEAYNDFVRPLKDDIYNLRAALQATESKQKKRGWLNRQSHGELDDSMLIDGATGEKYIYKRRGAVAYQGINRDKPKRLRFVMDCSGSMYRFNGYDQRLNRCLEAAVLIMESFECSSDGFDYSIVGHSGDSKCIELVNFGQPPKDDKARMTILQTMAAHSQFCQKGDNTIDAIRQAMVDIVEVDGDDNGIGEDCVVVVISDANLARYGIKPKELSNAMTDNRISEEVTIKAYSIFIASFGDEAHDVTKELPIGRGYVCMDTSELPRIVRNILAAEIV